MSTVLKFEMAKQLKRRALKVARSNLHSKAAPSKGFEERRHGNISVGEKITIHYGPTCEKMVTYKAIVVDVCGENTASPTYLVHYQGWNHRYDEWVPRERIGQKIRKKKKVVAVPKVFCPSNPSSEVPPGLEALHLLANTAVQLQKLPVGKPVMSVRSHHVSLPSQQIAPSDGSLEASGNIGGRFSKSSSERERILQFRKDQLLLTARTEMEPSHVQEEQESAPVVRQRHTES